MELRSDHEWMVLEFADLDELSIRREAAGNDAHALQELPIGVVELVAMAVALLDLVYSVRLAGARAGYQAAGIAPQPHRSALLGYAFLLGKEADHRVLRIRRELA